MSQFQVSVSLSSDLKPLQCENDEGTERFSVLLRCDFMLFLRLSFIQIVFLLVPRSSSLYAGMFGAFTVLTRLALILLSFILSVGETLVI